MKKTISLIVSIVMLLSLIACGGGAGGEELQGKYLLSSLIFGEDKMTYADLMMLGMSEGSFLDFQGDGTVMMGIAGDSAAPGSIDLKNSTITDPTGETVQFVIEGDSIHVSASDGSTLIYTLEGSPDWEQIQAEPGMMSDALAPLEGDTSRSDEEFVSPTLTMIELRSIYDAINNALIDNTISRATTDYETIVANYFGGVEGQVYQSEETYIKYWWESVESEASGVFINFNNNEESGIWEMGNMSINNIP